MRSTGYDIVWMLAKLVFGYIFSLDVMSLPLYLAPTSPCRPHLLDCAYPPLASSTDVLLKVTRHSHCLCYRRPGFARQRERQGMSYRQLLIMPNLSLRRDVNVILLLQWIEEVRSICGPTIPIILVGCKSDLRPPEGMCRQVQFVQSL